MHGHMHCLIEHCNMPAPSVCSVSRQAVLPAKAGAVFVPHTAHAQRYGRVHAAASDDDRAEQMKAMQEALSNPAVAAKVNAVQEAMAAPEVKQQMEEMSAVMSNPKFLQRMAELKEDPELKPMFEAIKAGGMPAMMKSMNDPAFLSKIASRMGDIEEMIGGAPPSTAAAAAVQSQEEEVEINNICDAAKYGDLEAIEDFIAIQKMDVTDENGRTALHYAVAYDQGAAASALLAAGADVNVADSQGNTALHFAAGYGRGSAVRALLNVGANVAATNAQGENAGDVVKRVPRNPLNQDGKLLAVLDGTAAVESLQT